MLSSQYPPSQLRWGSQTHVETDTSLPWAEVPTLRLFISSQLSRSVGSDVTSPPIPRAC